MPVLNLRVAPLQNPEQYRALGRALTDITARVLHKEPAVTAVVIDDLPAARWCVGGEAVDRPAAQLEIVITAGTNTEAEKAAFIRAAFEELQRQLGRGEALEPASYVIVREMPAADWGRGGMTQQARRAARLTAA